MTSNKYSSKSIVVIVSVVVVGYYLIKSFSKKSPDTTYSNASGTLGTLGNVNPGVWVCPPACDKNGNPLLKTKRTLLVKQGGYA